MHKSTCGMSSCEGKSLQKRLARPAASGRSFTTRGGRTGVVCTRSSGRLSRNLLGFQRRSLHLSRSVGAADFVNSDSLRDSLEDKEGVEADVNPFFDADENKTYQDKIPSTMLKVDWRFPRPGIVYPLFERTRLLVGWNAVRILRQNDSLDPKVLRKYERTHVSTFCYCLSWLWYLIPSPLVFLYDKTALRIARPVVRQLHKQAFKLYAKLRLAALEKKKRKHGGVSPEDARWLSSIIEVYHGGKGALSFSRDCFMYLVVLLVG